jgi:hypothetical protein
MLRSFWARLIRSAGVAIPTQRPQCGPGAPLSALGRHEGRCLVLGETERIAGTAPEARRGVGQNDGAATIWVQSGECDGDTRSVPQAIGDDPSTPHRVHHRHQVLDVVLDAQLCTCRQRVGAPATAAVEKDAAGMVLQPRQQPYRGRQRVVGLHGVFVRQEVEIREDPGEHHVVQRSVPPTR